MIDSEIAGAKSSSGGEGLRVASYSGPWIHKTPLEGKDGKVWNVRFEPV